MAVLKSYSLKILFITKKVFLFIFDNFYFSGKKKTIHKYQCYIDCILVYNLNSNYATCQQIVRKS